MQYVRVKSTVAGFLVGSRFVTPSDGPFAVDDDYRAAVLIKAGLVERCAPLSDEPGPASSPNPKKVERAMLKR